MNTDRKRVLITGARAPITLHLARILNEGGMDVYVGDSVDYALSKSSNSISAFLLYPSPKYHTEEFINCLIDFQLKRQIDILVPTCEEVFYISMYQEKLSSYNKVLVDEFKKMNLLHNKERFIQFVKNLGFVTPRTTLLTPELNRSTLSELNTDFVLKKVYSRFSDSVAFYKHGAKLPKKVSNDSTWIVQERIEGQQYCSYGIAKNGKLLAHSVYKSEFTAGLGATLTFEYIDRKDIETFVREIVKELSFTGQISFDFIINKDDVAIPIECNPRATSGLHLFGKEITNVINDQQDCTLYPKKDTKQAIKLAVLLYGVLQIKSLKQAKQFCDVLFTFKDSIYRHHDKKPYFYQFISMFNIWKESKENQVTMLEQSTFDLSWDGEES